MRKYYAFAYTDGINTTYANKPNKICGEVHKFTSKSERNEFIKSMHYTQKNNLKACLPVRRKDIYSLGHRDYFIEKEV